MQRLSDINDGLNEWANSGGGGPSSVAGQHTLQRHRDILQVRNIFMLSYEKIEIGIKQIPKSIFFKNLSLHFRIIVKNSTKRDQMWPVL